VGMSPLRAVGFLRRGGRWKAQRARGDCTRATHGLPLFALARLPIFPLSLSFLPVGRREDDGVSRCRTRRCRSQERGDALGIGRECTNRRCARRVAVGGGILLHSPLSWSLPGPSSLSFPVLPLTEGSSFIPLLLLLLSVIILLVLMPVSTAARSSALLPEVHSHGVTPLLCLSLSSSVSPLPPTFKDGTG
jgi:hypothetical protein